MNLPPGVYDIRVASDGSLLPIQWLPTVVTIVARKSLTIEIMLDSGIR